MQIQSGRTVPLSDYLVIQNQKVKLNHYERVPGTLKPNDCDRFERTGYAVLVEKVGLFLEKVGLFWKKPYFFQIVKF